MLKNFLRELTPPIVFSALRMVYKRVKIGTPIFDGLYSSLADVPRIEEDPFVHPNWISYVGPRAESRKGGVSYQDMHEMCLSLIASMLPEALDEAPQAIIDFGGGVGMYWPALKAQNKAGRAGDFIVVDNEKNCVSGKALFGAEGVRFESDFDRVIKAAGSIHLINVASTLHYCLDHEAVIAMLCGSGARFIVVSRHPAQDDGLPVAYTVQNVITVNGFCGQIPVVLISVKTLSDLMHGHGYKLISDYYTKTDPDKYWINSRTTVAAEFSQIIDHALVFQKQPILPAATHHRHLPACND